MNAMTAVKTDPRSALIEQCKKISAGMLGLEGSRQHPQPMTHYTDWDNDALWFLTSKDTDLVRALGAGGRAIYVLVAPHQDFHASLSGSLTETMDRGRLDRFWSPVASAWFEGGKDDPMLTMLRFKLDEAALWGSSDSALKFGIEIARANVQPEHEPEVGAHRVLTF